MSAAQDVETAVVLVGHFGLHAAAMGRYAPPASGDHLGEWVCEHDASVTLRLRTDTHVHGSAMSYEWVVTTDTDGEILTAAVEHSVAAVLADEDASPWAFAKASLTTTLRWHVAAAAPGAFDLAIRARCISVDKAKRTVKVAVQTAEASAQRIVARAKEVAEERANPAAFAAKKAKKMAAAAKKAERAQAAKGRKKKGDADDDEEYDYADAWYPPPVVAATDSFGGHGRFATTSAPPPRCPLCAYCKPYNQWFTLFSILGGALEAASSIFLYWLVFRFVSAYLDTQGGDLQWQRGIDTTIALACLGVISSIGVFLNHTLLPISVENQMDSVRLKFMKRALSQEVAWCVHMPPPSFRRFVCSKIDS